MVLEKVDYDFSVCKVENYSLIDLNTEFCFTGKTDNENSLVCLTDKVPINAIETDNGWKAFRIQGILEFSLIGVLSEISQILAENNIAVFVISTFDTDYILTKSDNYQKAINILCKAGYKIAN